MVREVPQDILNMVRMARCQIVYSPRYTGLVISHLHVSEVLYCKTVEQLKVKVESFIKRMSTIKGV